MSEEKYYVKVGKLYITSYDVDVDSIETDFVNSIMLDVDKREALTFTEKERWKIKEKIIKVLELDCGNAEDMVTFEDGKYE